jgi:hypothetical protein
MRAYVHVGRCGLRSYVCVATALARKQGGGAACQYHCHTLMVLGHGEGLQTAAPAHQHVNNMHVVTAEGESIAEVASRLSSCTAACICPSSSAHTKHGALPANCLLSTCTWDATHRAEEHTLNAAAAHCKGNMCDVSTLYDTSRGLYLGHTVKFIHS